MTLIIVLYQSFIFSSITARLGLCLTNLLIQNLTCSLTVSSLCTCFLSSGLWLTSATVSRPDSDLLTQLFSFAQVWVDDMSYSCYHACLLSPLLFGARATHPFYSHRQQHLISYTLIKKVDNKATYQVFLH